MGRPAVTLVQPIDGVEFRGLAVDAAEIYGQAMNRSRDVIAQRREVIDVHVTYPGFVAAGAFATCPTDANDDHRQLVGFGYGYLGAAGQWWHDTVVRGLGREGAHRWMREGFELAELHVLPSHHGRGLGRALLTDVLARAAGRHAVLSTPDIESPARLLYRSYGFADLCVDFRFPGSVEPYAIMGVDLAHADPAPGPADHRT